MRANPGPAVESELLPPASTVMPTAAKANPTTVAVDDCGGANACVVATASRSSLSSRAAIARSSVSSGSGGTGLPDGRDGDDGKSAGALLLLLLLLPAVSTYTPARLPVPPCGGDSAEPRKLAGEAADARIKLLGELADAAAARAVSSATCDAIALVGAGDDASSIAAPTSAPNRVGGRLATLTVAVGGPAAHGATSMPDGGGGAATELAAALLGGACERTASSGSGLCSELRIDAVVVAWVAVAGAPAGGGREVELSARCASTGAARWSGPATPPDARRRGVSPLKDKELLWRRSPPPPPKAESAACWSPAAVAGTAGPAAAGALPPAAPAASTPAQDGGGASVVARPPSPLAPPPLTPTLVPAASTPTPIGACDGCMRPPPPLRLMGPAANCACGPSGCARIAEGALNGGPENAVEATRAPGAFIRGGCGRACNRVCGGCAEKTVGGPELAAVGSDADASCTAAVAAGDENASDASTVGAGISTGGGTDADSPKL